MLNDVETFQGRDANYKNRVNQAIKNWDYLISPSPYARALKQHSISKMKFLR